MGELLRDADHLARSLLLDLDGDDAATLVRSWPALVDAAAAAWSAVDVVATPPAAQIAARADQPPPRDDTDPMSRLHAVTGGIANTLATARWPGHGAGSHTGEEIAGNLDRVTQLLERHAADLPLNRSEVRADIAAAQMRLMHTVYLVAHATTSSLQQLGRQLHADTSSDRRPLPLACTGLPYAVGPTSRWVQRIGVCENIAGRYVRRAHGGITAALAGEVMPTPDEPDRLQRALALWDIQVHRTLATQYSPHNLVLAGRTQAFIAATAVTLLDALDHAESVGEEPHDVAGLAAVVEVTASAWNRLASRWSDLAPIQAGPHPDLAQAAAHVRTAARELTHSPTGKAAPDLIATRADLSWAVASLEDALAAGVDVAHLIADLARDPDLTGPARPLSVRAQNDTAAANDRRHRGEPEQDVLWVTPREVLGNKQVPLPRPVAEGLVLASEAVRRSALRAASSAQTHEAGQGIGRETSPHRRPARNCATPGGFSDPAAPRRR